MKKDETIIFYIMFPTGVIARLRKHVLLCGTIEQRAEMNSSGTRLTSNEEEGALILPSY